MLKDLVPLIMEDNNEAESSRPPTLRAKQLALMRHRGQNATGAVGMAADAG